MNSKIRLLRKKLSEVQRRLGSLSCAPPKRRRVADADLQTMRQTVGEEIKQLQQQIDAMAKTRKKLPTKIKVRDLPYDSRFRLETERKILTHAVKLIAYRVESALLIVIRPHLQPCRTGGTPANPGDPSSFR